MKKLLAAAAVVMLVPIGAWWLHSLRRQLRHSAERAVEPQAMMIDEDAPREIVPTVSLQVNEDLASTVPAGTPVWFTVAVNNAAALNELSAAGALATRLAHVAPDAPDRRRLQSDYDHRSRPAAITLGDAAHPWTDAVQLLTRDAQGGERALGIPVRRLGPAPATQVLDAYTSARANFGAAELDAASGAYSIVACLGQTGSWRGRTCSEPVRLTVQERPAHLPADRQSLADHRAGRLALLAGDVTGLEQAARRLLAADPADVEGHMYLGESHFLQNRREEALAQFTAARATFRRNHPNAAEPPRFLDARIGQLIGQPDPAP